MPQRGAPLRGSLPNFGFLATIALLVGCSGGGGSGASSASVAPGATTAASTSLVLQLGSDLPAGVRARVEALVRGATKRAVEVRSPADSIADLTSGAVAIAVGDTTTTRSLISTSDLASLASEGFLVRSRVDRGVTVLAADGTAPSPDPLGLKTNVGASYGA